MSLMNPEATAYHEAGHAVIALVLGRSVQRVSVLPKLYLILRLYLDQTMASLNCFSIHFADLLSVHK